MTDKRTISVTVNGTKYTKEVAVRVTLADFIRYDLQLTGTHLGCEHGVCGA
jgi:carbon-monoxide dehydrogenase small subunit